MTKRDESGKQGPTRIPIDDRDSEVPVSQATPEATSEEDLTAEILPEEELTAEILPEEEPSIAADPFEVQRLEDQVQRLEVALQEKESRLQEVVSAFRRKEQELDQIRERLERDREKRILQEKNRLFGQLFHPMDNLLASVKALDGTETCDVEALVNGLRNLDRSFADAFASMGLERIDPLGEEFNPELHEAITAVPVTDKKQHNRILNVVKVGYLSDGTVVRPALVVVGRKS